LTAKGIEDVLGARCNSKRIERPSKKRGEEMPVGKERKRNLDSVNTEGQKAAEPGLYQRRPIGGKGTGEIKRRSNRLAMMPRARQSLKVAKRILLLREREKGGTSKGVERKGEVANQRA